MPVSIVTILTLIVTILNLMMIGKITPAARNM